MTGTMIIGTGFLLAAALLLTLAVRLFIISLGYRKGKTVRVNAWLDKTDYTPKINSHDRQGRYIRCSTNATYSYIVDGTRYSVEHSVDNAKPGDLPGKMKVVYQKEHPERAYLANFPVPIEAILCGACVLFFLVFLWTGILFIRG